MEKYSYVAFLCVYMLLVSRRCLSYEEQTVEEDVYITHLPDARVMAHFEFKTAWNIHPLIFAQKTGVWHYGLFPKSLAEVVGHYQVQELHLALTQGKWRTRVWGYPPYSAPPGAELWAWFLPQSNAESEWAGLVNALSGLVCAHLNSISPKSTYQPLHSFRPHGAVLGNLSSKQMRYAALPRETVCTENFTPWTKLLPCGTSAGLASLFSTQVLFDSEYHSLGLHFEPTCQDSECTEVGVELRQTLTVVFPPLLKKGYVEWTLKELFGNIALSSVCPLASRSRLLLHLTSGLQVLAEPPSDERWLDEWMVYNIDKVTRNAKQFNLLVRSISSVTPGMPAVPVLTVQRFLSGSGHGWGGLSTVISNNHASHTLQLLYLDMIPWFCRVFIHTLQVEHADVTYHHYQPAKDRKRPHMMELLLHVPPRTTATISVQFSRAFLKWNEHPPDAHHGFYINSALITTVLEDCTNCTFIGRAPHQSSKVTALRLHTESLLISLPTPDFSMPYNVICFVCTVIAIGFGSIFNLVTRTLEPVTSEKTKLQRLVNRLKTMLQR